MKQKKREYMPLYSFYDRTGVTRHLEEMAARGWLVEKLNGWYWQYRRIDPKQLQFTVTYFPKASQFAPYPAEGLETFWDFCAEAGWVLAADNAQVQVFYNENLHATPIETDPEADFQTIHRSMKKSAVAGYRSLLLLSLLECGFLLWQLFHDPIGKLSDPLQLSSAFGFVPLGFLASAELIRYSRWQKRCRAALEVGDPLPELGSARWLSIFIWILVAAELFVLLTSSFHASRGMAITLVLMLLYICLMLWLANGIRRALQHLRVRSWINLLVTVGVLIALMIGMFSGITFLVLNTDLFSDPNCDTYEYKGHTFTVYHDELPLIVGDLVSDDYENWSTQLTRKSSPLLTHIEANQRSRLGDGDHPDLSYEIVIVKAPFLYDLCRQDYISWLERHNHEVPQEHWDEYRLTDAAPWGAAEVYQRYSSGEPINQFLICWPDRIAEINFDWEWNISDKLIAVTAEKLRAVQ